MAHLEKAKMKGDLKEKQDQRMVEMVEMKTKVVSLGRT
jgi:hypothetical protein